MTERISNNASTTLNGSINNSTTTLVVTNAFGFPTSGNFRIIIGGELLLVTGVSGNTFTVTRGIESTGAASHTSGVNVTHVLTAGSMFQLITENSAPSGPVNSHTSADFTAVNSPTVTDETGAIVVTAPADTSFNWRLLSFPASGIATVVTAMEPFALKVGSNYDYVGLLGFRDSVNDLTLLVTLFQRSVDALPQLAVQQWTALNNQSASSTVKSIGAIMQYGPNLWTQIENDGTDLIVRMSSEGTNWVEIYREAVGDFVTPDTAVFGAANWADHLSDPDVYVRCRYFDKS